MAVRYDIFTTREDGEVMLDELCPLTGLRYRLT
jgi:hypothetical protein